MLGQTAKHVILDIRIPNIAKDMHVDHLRNNIMGHTLARIVEFLGYSNNNLKYTGDLGTHYGLLNTYMKSGSHELLVAKKTSNFIAIITGIPQ